MSSDWKTVHDGLRVMIAPNKLAEMEWRTTRTGVNTAKHIILSGVLVDELPPFLAKDLRDDLDYLLKRVES